MFPHQYNDWNKGGWCAKIRITQGTGFNSKDGNIVVLFSVYRLSRLILVSPNSAFMWGWRSAVVSILILRRNCVPIHHSGQRGFNGVDRDSVKAQSENVSTGLPCGWIIDERKEHTHKNKNFCSSLGLVGTVSRCYGKRSFILYWLESRPGIPMGTLGESLEPTGFRMMCAYL